MGCHGDALLTDRHGFDPKAAHSSVLAAFLTLYIVARMSRPRTPTQPPPGYPGDAESTPTSTQHANGSTMRLLGPSDDERP